MFVWQDEKEQNFRTNGNAYDLNFEENCTNTALSSSILRLHKNVATYFVAGRRLFVLFCLGLTPHSTIFQSYGSGQLIHLPGQA